MEVPSVFIRVSNVSLNNFELSNYCHVLFLIPRLHVKFGMINEEKKTEWEKQFTELCWCCVGTWKYMVVYLLTYLYVLSKLKFLTYIVLVLLCMTNCFKAFLTCLMDGLCLHFSLLNCVWNLPYIPKKSDYNFTD